ncbi:hypothetical protein FISHEDRAFT_59872 [Fistulina hepatica ATCC 64428]|uniref:Uncharacterized protein n=1 Tax=Fistulina hepatica ATCC 64428 TaxID=1128425 RepID=A0A0D7AB10_9AGAR|nr:hypothetical protein FISHEDRAFT_59872 [Fistulina hepatica ATCC 64428]
MAVPCLAATDISKGDIHTQKATFFRTISYVYVPAAYAQTHIKLLIMKPGMPWHILPYPVIDSSAYVGSCGVICWRPRVHGPSVYGLDARITPDYARERLAIVWSNIPAARRSPSMKVPLSLCKACPKDRGSDIIWEDCVQGLERSPVLSVQ